MFNQSLYKDAKRNKMKKVIKKKAETKAAEAPEVLPFQEENMKPAEERKKKAIKPKAKDPDPELKVNPKKEEAKEVKAPRKKKPSKEDGEVTNKTQKGASKYIYPENCKEYTDRKKFRATVRTKLAAYERKLSVLDQASAEYKKLAKEAESYQKEVMAI